MGPKALDSTLSVMSDDDNTRGNDTRGDATCSDDACNNGSIMNKPALSRRYACCDTVGDIPDEVAKQV